MATLHIVTNPDALAAALATCAGDDELVLIHRAASFAGQLPAGARILDGVDDAGELLELCLRHRRKYAPAPGAVRSAR